MALVTLYGPPQSSYTWSALMICAEKGISVDNQPIEFGSPDHARLHPFKKVPILVHGAVTVWETEAIGRYVDRVFDGPALQPDNPSELALMDSWLSAIVDYYYPALVRRIVLPRLFGGPDGGPVDEADIATAARLGAEYLDVLEAGLAEQRYLAGGSITLADINLMPVIAYLGQMPEGQDMMVDRPNLGRWFGALKARESYRMTAPFPADPVVPDAAA